jgi:TetR/AcrR family transcriptional repressor of nem operon
LEAASGLIWESSYSSASVDAICQRAGVNKGSFYHFFPSKSELAVTALEAEWESRKPHWDACFSPLVPPLERFARLHAECMEEQTRLAAETGCVIGCPLFSLGS